MTFSRHYLAQRATLDAVDLAEVQGCRRAHNQLGFAYQVGFVRLFNRCLTLIVACIIYWQAKDISRVIRTASSLCCATSARSSGTTSSCTVSSPKMRSL